MRFKTKITSFAVTTCLLTITLAGCSVPVDENSVGKPSDPIHTYTPAPEPTEQAASDLVLTTDKKEITDYWSNSTDKIFNTPKWNAPDAQVDTKTGDMIVRELNFPAESFNQYLGELRDNNTLEEFDSSTTEEQNADYDLYFFESEKYVLEITVHPDRNDPSDQTSGATFFRIYVKPSN